MNFSRLISLSHCWPNPPELPGKAVDFLRRARNGKVPASARELGGRSDFNFVPKVKVRRSLGMKVHRILSFGWFWCEGLVSFQAQLREERRLRQMAEA